MNRDLALTLAGGGNRAFFQQGILNHWWSELEPRLGAVGATSAGACIAVLRCSGRQREAHEFWLRRRAHVTRNFEWTRLIRGERPTPHYPVYRDTMLFALDDGGFERIRALPFPIYVLVSVPPAALPIGWAVPLGLAAYSLERWLNPGRLHPGAGRRLGFEPLAVDIRTVSSPEAAAELVLAASATPPFTPVGRLDGRRVLDGGVVDNAPAFVADRAGSWRRHLVLLTRPYPPSAVGIRGHRWYVCPRSPVPADRWDYTRPDRIADTITLGEREGAARLDELCGWLAD